MNEFCHLHRHSEFSRLDGVGTAKQYADRAAELGQRALAQTDHGTLSGALHHIAACREAKVFPISGVEAYFRPDRAKAKEEGNRRAWHLCLFAKNLRGWHSLLKIVSAAYGEIEDGGGFYQVPCVDWDLLERYNEGLVCSTACISSWLSELVNLGHSNDVRSYINRMRKIFGDDLWVEIMPHDFEEQRVLNFELVSVANDFSIPLIATNDAHFPYKDWADTHRVAKMMGTSKSFDDVRKDQEKGKADYLADLNPTLYLADREEMFYWFDKFHPDIPVGTVEEAMGNTILFTESFTPYLLDKAMKLPKVTQSVADSEKILQGWISDGMSALFETWMHEDKLSLVQATQRRKEYQERVDTEWEILSSKGVLDYFVLVGEVVRWCASDEPLPPVKKGEKDLYPAHRIKWFKKKPIRVGLGRGSAAGCLISYLVGIVRIDPIPYKLLFERFLNPNRKGLPDIDLDFQSDRRAEVKEFIARRYGRDHVADIITHQRFQPKKVLVDLARTFDLDYMASKKVTDTIEIGQDDEETTLEELLPLNEKLKEFRDVYPEIWKHALRLEGTVANAGKHAAGVVITPRPVSAYMALERGNSGDLVTSWSDSADFAIISDFGFVKLDALGIKGLQKHEYACELIKERTGKEIDLYALPALRDPYAAEDKVMQGFRDGHTVGVFQFASAGITKLLRSIKPDNIFDIAAANALYRPGPLNGGMAWDFPKRKKNVFMREYIHPDLKEYLESTYGVIVFQEQVMKVSGGIGRLSPGDTDDMRKAMGKLYRIKGGTAARDFMRRFEIPFFEGAEEDHGWTHEQAEQVWDLFLGFGAYSFNASHSCSYALQAYQDMWLKTHYPLEFYASFLTYEDDDQKIKDAFREARAIGIDFALPDINTAVPGFTTDGEKLILGLISISGMGWKSAKAAVKAAPFTTTNQFFRAKGFPHKQLIQSGACDSFLDRSYMLSIVDKVKRDGSEESWYVWEHLKRNTTLKKPREVPKFRKEPSTEMLQALQQQSYTISIKGSSLNPKVVEYIHEHCHLSEEFSELRKGDEAVAGGEITRVVFKKTAAGKEYCNAVLTFESESWNLKFWQEAVDVYREDLLVEGMEVMVSGQKDVWNDYQSIVVRDMIAIEEFFQEDEQEEAVEHGV